MPILAIRWNTFLEAPNIGKGVDIVQKTRIGEGGPDRLYGTILDMSLLSFVINKEELI